MPRDDRAPEPNDGRRERIRRSATLYAVGLIAITGAVALASGAWRDGKPGASSSTVPIAAPNSTTFVEITVAPTTVAVPTTVKAATPCPLADGSSPRTVSFTTAPAMCIDPAATYTAVIKTSKGQVLIRLDQQASPAAVNTFVYLARYHFYDGLEFHRVVSSFLMQAGDPTGTGEGGPGFTINADAGSGAFSVGSVAMTGKGTGTNGSQFFIVSGKSGVDNLTAVDYSPLGRVINGLPVVKAIDSLAVDPGDTQGKPPSTKVTIDQIDIRATGEQASTPSNASTTRPSTTTTSTTAAQ